MLKKAFLLSNTHCEPGQSDLNLLSTYLKKNGWQLSRTIGRANIVIIYTCAVSRLAEDHAIKIIKQAQADKDKNALLIVTGCLPSINKTRLKHIFKGTTVSASSLEKFDEILNPKYLIREIKYTGSDRALKENKDKIFSLRTGWGCYGNCSYCAVKFVFGKLKSRPISSIVQEFDKAYNKGYRKFALAAHDVGCYGKDLGISLADLIESLCQKHKNCEFVLSDITPNTLKSMLPSLEKFIRSGEIFYIKMPVQSGSNRVLRLMNRLYSVADFQYCVERLISYNPDLKMITDIIVGFPSETEKDFLDTLRLVGWLGRAKIHLQLCAYTNRPNIEASKLSGQIDEKIKMDRLKRAEDLRALNHALRKKRILLDSSVASLGNRPDFFGSCMDA